MPTLRELQEQRETLVAAARERLNQINANTDESRAAELETQHDAAMAELDTLDANIAREERVADAERSQNERAERRERELRNRRPIDGVDDTGAGDAPAAVAYRQAFGAYIRAQGNVALLSDEQRSVLQRGYQVIPAEQRAQTTANAAGGYTIPIEIQSHLIRAMKKFGPMYDPGVCTEIVTSGGYSMPFPTVDDTANTGAATTQGVTLLDDASGDVVLGQKALGAFSFATPWLRVSKELADDSLQVMESLLGSLLGERLGRLANSQLTIGVGTTAPTGIVVASTVGVTAALTTAFTADEVIDLEHSVDPAYRESPDAAFMFHDAVLKAIRKLKDGQGNYLWQAGNVQQGVPGTFNGRKYFVNQAMSSAFTTGQKLAIFGDLSKYFVRKVGAPLIGALQDKDFWPGFGVAGWIRFDGNLMDTTAVKHLKLA
jgi:HK97 family phage major capsid protein